MRGLLPFLASRLLRAAIALWLVSTVVFVVMRLSGDPVPLLLPSDAPQSEFARVRAELGLDRPLPVQYAVFLAHVLHGDFGQSIHFRQPAFRVVVGYLPATIELGLAAFTLALLVALPIGVISAVKRNSVLDQATMGLALVGQSAPTFFIGILLILIVSLNLGRLAIQSIYNRDYPVVQCTVFISAVLFIVINFVVDLIYGLLDPRVRSG